MKPIVIVQITESLLKVSPARQSGGVLEASVWATEPVTGLGDELIAEKLARIFRDFKLRQPAVVISLGRNTVTVRNLHLPSRIDDEIRQMVELKLARLVPHKREDVIFDFTVSGSDAVGYARVLLSVVRTEAVRRCAAIVEKAGGEVDRIVLSSYGVWQKARALVPAQDTDDVFLALDVDSDFTDFIIFSPSELLFTRTINIGARALLENKDGVVARFMADLQQSLMMFYNEELNKKPARVFVSGAKIAGELARHIESGLAVDVVCAGGPAAGVPEDVSVFGLSCIDTRDRKGAGFVLAEIQVRKTLSRTVRELVILGGLCVYLLSIGYLFYWGRVYHQQNYLAMVRERAAAVEKTLGDLPGKFKKIEFVRERLESRKAVLFVMVELQKAVPAKASVVFVSVEETGRVVVRGQAEELADVFKFVDNLEKSGGFRDVQTRSTKKKKTLGRDLIEFELNFLLK